MTEESKKRAGVAALVVTYNREELLCEALDAVLAQDAPLECVIVVDNASTDGTPELFAAGARFDLPIIDYRRMEENLGGAGGFKEGIRVARDTDCAWVWLMDDDCIAESGTLHALLFASEQVACPSFLASCVFGKGEVPMNLPTVDERPSPNGCADWYRELHNGLVRIQSATFVSLLVNLEAVDAVGLPIASFFLWGDDSEYTMRLTGYFGPAYFVGNSRVLHKRSNAKSLDVRNEDNPNRIKRYWRLYRNNLIVARYHRGRKASRRKVAGNLLLCLKLLCGRGALRVRMARAGAVFKGTFEYVRHAYDLEDLEKLLCAPSTTACAMGRASD